MWSGQWKLYFIGSMGDVDENCPVRPLNSTNADAQSVRE